MKRHLFRTEADAESFQALFAEVAKRGLRAGWLDLAAADAVPNLEASAVDGGAFRSVSVKRNRVVSVKRIDGEAVLKDLLREYFAGCHLVVVRGPLEAPEITPGGRRYTLRSLDGTEHEWSARALAASLGRARLTGSRRKGERRRGGKAGASSA